MQAFRAAVEHLDGTAALRLEGELDLAGVDELEAAFRPLLHRYDADQLELDCARLTFVDAHALGVLLRIIDRFGPGGRPCLCSPSPALRRLLSLTGAEERFAVSP